METSTARMLSDDKKIEKVQEIKPTLSSMSFKRVDDITLIENFINGQSVDLARLTHIFLRPREIEHRSRYQLQQALYPRFKDKLNDTDHLPIREQIILGLFLYGKKEKDCKDAAIKILNHLKKATAGKMNYESGLIYYLTGLLHFDIVMSKFTDQGPYQFTPDDMRQLTQARDCFTKANNLNVIEALTLSGIIALIEQSALTQNGLMVLAANKEMEAEKYFRLAAERGSNRAKVELASLYEKLNIHPEKINDLYLTAIQNGNYLAAEPLGRRYQAEGNPDYILLYRKGCEDEYPDAIDAIEDCASKSDSLEVLYHCALAIGGFNDYNAPARLRIQKKLEIHFSKSSLPFVKLFIKSGDTWNDLTIFDSHRQEIFLAVTKKLALEQYPEAARYVRMYVENELSTLPKANHEPLTQEEEKRAKVITKIKLGYCTAILRDKKAIAAPEFIYHRALAVRNYPGPLRDEMLASLETFIKKQSQVFLKIFKASGDTWEILHSLLQYSKIPACDLEKFKNSENTSDHPAGKVVTPSSLFHQAIIYNTPKKKEECEAQVASTVSTHTSIQLGRNGGTL